MRTKKRKQVPMVVCPVQIALEAAHTLAAKLGRPLHPIETRWVVQAEFRQRFIGLHEDLANEFADSTIEKIRTMIG